MKRIGLLGLLALVLLGLAGCGSAFFSASPWEEVIDSEDMVATQALALADQAEAFLAAQSLIPQDASTRPVTVARDSEGITVLALPRAYEPPQTPEDLAHTPLGLVIKCKSTPPIHCSSGAGKIESQSGRYQVRWTWRSMDGSPREELVSAEVEVGSQGYDPAAKPRLSYNRIGLLGFWADSLIQWPFFVHIAAPSPSRAEAPAEFITPRDPTLPFLEALRKACCGLPTDYPKIWPPAILLREDIALAFIPLQNPRLATASSPDDLLNEPLGLLYLRQASKGKLTKADASKLLMLRLVREEPDWMLMATDLANPGQTLRFLVGQVDWCDGCFGQDPPPRYLGIEDRLNGSPLVHLQVGPLMLRGIEKKDIRR